MSFADHLGTRSRHPVLDDPARFTDAFHPPASFNARAFQRKLNQVAGKSDTGQPVVRLVWGWHAKEWEKGEFRLKYRCLTVPLDGGDYVDIGVPRWILEERHEPGQYWASWEASRWVEDVETGERVDMKGEPPRDGWYTYLALCAEHDPDKSCCFRLWRDQRRRCWGYYREPNEADIQMVARAVQIARERHAQSPHEPLTEATLERAHRDGAFRSEETERERKRLISDLWDQEMSAHSHRLVTDDPSVLAHGKYHFIPQKQFKETSSGLLVPQ